MYASRSLYTLAANIKFKNTKNYLIEILKNTKIHTNKDNISKNTEAIS